jgi:hypothetical protein
MNTVLNLPLPTAYPKLGNKPLFSAFIMVEYLPSKCKALNSNPVPSPLQKKKEKKKMEK